MGQTYSAVSLGAARTLRVKAVRRSVTTNKEKKKTRYNNEEFDPGSG